MTKSPWASLLIATLISWFCVTGIHALPSTMHAHRSLARRRVCLDADGAGPSGAPGWQRSETCTADTDCASREFLPLPDESIRRSPSV